MQLKNIGSKVLLADTIHIKSCLAMKCKLNKLVRNKKHWLNKEVQNKSFEEYLNLLLEVGYQTQYSFLGGNEFIDYVDYIGYFENLKKDWQKIAENIS